MCLVVANASQTSLGMLFFPMRVSTSSSVQMTLLIISNVALCDPHCTGTLQHHSKLQKTNYRCYTIKQVYLMRAKTVFDDSVWFAWHKQYQILLLSFFQWGRWGCLCTIPFRSNRMCSYTIIFLKDIAFQLHCILFSKNFWKMGFRNNFLKSGFPYSFEQETEFLDFWEGGCHCNIIEAIHWWCWY